MRKLAFALLLTTLLSSSALAQYYVVPGGALRPDGGLIYDVPGGAPFSLRPPVWDPSAGPLPGFHPSLFWYRDTPTYWVAYPLVTVPIGKLPPAEPVPEPTVPAPTLPPSQPRPGVSGNTSSN